jgi:type 1 glutamine amidotransferase
LPNGTGGTEDLSVSGQGRYIRLTGTVRATPWGFSLWEFQVFGNPADTTPPVPQISIVSPLADQQYQAGDSVSLQVSVSDSQWFSTGGRYRYSLNGGSPVQVSSIAAVNLGVLPVGHHTLDVTLIDAQNQPLGASRSVSFSINQGGSETPPTPSPAQLSPVGATASSGNALEAIDGNTSTRWESAFSDPQYIQLDMGQSVYFTRAVLNWEGAYARSYTLEVSEDGATWQTVYSTTSGNGGIDDLALSDAQGRYIRMHGTERATGYGYSLWEFDVHGLAADPNLALISIAAPTEGQEIPESQSVVLQVGITDSTWIASGGSYHYILDNHPPVRVSHLDPVSLGILPTGQHGLRVSLVNGDGVEVSVPQIRHFRVSCGNNCPNVLVFSKTNGFRHGSIPVGIAMVESIAAANGYSVTTSEDSSLFTAANLAQYSTVIFMNTTGDIFTESEKTAFQAYIEGGGGYVGIHSAADTEHNWEWYIQTLLGGAKFIHHGDGIPHARMEIERPDHLIMNHIGDEWHLHEEWYFWESNPRNIGNIEILANLDRTSYPSNYPVEDHPVVFTNTVGDGRAFYTAKGHVDETFLDPRMIEMIRKAIEWTSGN